MTLPTTRALFPVTVKIPESAIVTLPRERTAAEVQVRDGFGLVQHKTLTVVDGQAGHGCRQQGITRLSDNTWS